jgi:hypothetical protein
LRLTPPKLPKTAAKTSRDLAMSPREPIAKKSNLPISS